MNKILLFKELNNPPEPLEDLVKKAHLLAKDSENVFYCPHAKEQMNKRKVSSRQVLDVLRNGNRIGSPNLDKYGDWRIKMKLYTAGRKVQVVAVVNENRIEVITVI